MRILCAGKFPPVVGGVSASSYWLLEALQARGHVTAVVTYPSETHHGQIVSEGHGTCLDTMLAKCALPKPQRLANVSCSASSVTSALLTTAARFEPTVLYTNYLEPYLLAGALVSRLLNIPHVCAHAGTDIEHFARDPGLSLGYRALLRTVDAFVAKSGEARRLVPSSNVTRVAPYYPGSAFFHERPPHRETNSLRVGVIGKLLASKCADLVLASLSLASGSIPRLECVLVGEMSALSANCSPLAFQRLGVLPPWDMPAAYRAMDVVVVLSRHDPVRSHTPVIPIEALSAGCVVVANRSVVARRYYEELFIDGENCVLIDDEFTAADVCQAVLKARDLCPARVNFEEYAMRSKRFADSWEAVLMSAIEGQA